MSDKILIIDDDPDILDALTMILESRGYTVSTARDGIEGLASLRAEKPNLMILDLLMPKMDGFAVLKELEDERWAPYRQIPIIVLTSVREEAARRRYQLETALSMHADDYIEKPIIPDILLQRVGNFLSGKQPAS